MDKLVPVLDYAYIYRMPEIIPIHLAGQWIDASLFTYLILNFFPRRTGDRISGKARWILTAFFTAFLFCEDILCQRNYYAYTLAMIMPPFLLSCFFLEGKVWLKAIVCMDFFATMSSMEIVIENLWRLLSTDYELARGTFVFLFFIDRIALKIILMVHIRLLMVNIRRKYDRKADAYWIATGGISCLSYLIGLYVLYTGAHDARTLPYDEIFAIVGAVLPIFSSFLMSVLLRNHENAKTVLAQNMLISAQRENIHSQEEVLADTRKFRHDYKAHLAAMQVLLEKGRYEELKEYLEKLSDSAGSQTVMVHFTGADVPDLILNQKKRAATAAGVDFAVMSEPGVFSQTQGPGRIELYDLNALLSNLCDNAIEAAAKCENGWVRISFSTVKAYLKIVSENTTEENVLLRNPDFHTDKPDAENHGYGMQIIRNIIDSYDGMLVPEGTEHSLKLTLLLRRQ